MNLRMSAWAIRNPIPVSLLFVLLTLAGIVAYFGLPVKQMPNISFPYLTVTITQSGAAPSEMENQITRPVENALTGIPGLKNISSTVTLGASTTVAEFELGTEMQRATDDVRTAVERARAELPLGIDPPSVQRVDLDSAPVATYVVSAPRMTATELAWFIDDTVARKLQAQRGVARITRIGGATREIGVILDPERMAALDVTAAEVSAALAAANSDFPGGRATVGAVEQTLRVIGSAQDVEAIRDLTIPVRGRHVRLSDIAEVGDGQGEVRGFARLNGRPVVAIQIAKTTSASDIDVDREVQAAIGRIGREHPGVAFTRIHSTAEDTSRSFAATTHGLVEGIILAVVVVFLFLRDWRATAIAATAMPLSLIPTFIFMAAMGFSLNGTTLLALTLVIGILVDDAIVEIENIQKRIDLGESAYRAALIGSDAIGLAVIATTATIIAVFAPVSLIPGQAGQFLKEFGLTVAAAVTFSLIVARLLTPLLAAYFLRDGTSAAHVPPALHPFHARVLQWVLDRPRKSAAIGAGLFFVAVTIGVTLQVGFQTTGNANVVYIAVQGSPGATRDAMSEAIQSATRTILRDADVEQVFAQAGSVSGSLDSAGDIRSGTLTVVLKRDRQRTSAEFQADLAPALRAIPGVRFYNQGVFGLAGFSVVLAGQDAAQLERTRSRLLREMATLRSIADPRPSPPAPGPEVVVVPRPAEAARLNVDNRSLANALRIATIGDIDAAVAKFSQGEQRLPIRVRFPEGARSDLAALANIRVPTRDGRTTPLSSVADIRFQSGPGRIERFNRERQLAIDADLAVGFQTGTALRDVQQLPTMRNLPAGVHQAEQGAVEAIGELLSGFVLAMVSGIGLTVAVLILLFRDFFKPFVILAALPLSLFGAFAALKLGGFAFDMLVLIGLLMLMGLCAKNSILLVEFAIEAQRAGRSMREALIEASEQRTRPIIMTSMAMIAGMLPTALGIGEGAEGRQPMAVAVIGGMVSSTLLSLILVPVVYEIADGIERRILPFLSRLIRPRPADAEDAEPAMG